MDKQSIIEQHLLRPADARPKPSCRAQSWAFNPDLPKHEYDPAKAKKILDEAGWMPGADGVREKNGVRLEFTNSTTAGNHVREQAQQLLQQNWREIGAKMNDQQPARRRDVGRLLDDVEIRERRWSASTS